MGTVASLSARRQARDAEPPAKHIPDIEVLNWLEDMDSATSEFIADMAPCSCQDVAYVIGRSIELLTIRRQPYLDALAKAAEQGTLV